MGEVLPSIWPGLLTEMPCWFSLAFIGLCSDSVISSDMFLCSVLMFIWSPLSLKEVVDVKLYPFVPAGLAGETYISPTTSG